MKLTIIFISILLLNACGMGGEGDSQKMVDSASDSQFGKTQFGNARFSK